MIKRLTNPGCIRKSPPTFRDLIKFRYRLIPYFYDLLWRSHRDYAPWDRPPLLARADSAIPLNVAEQHFAKPGDQRGFYLFPSRNDSQFEYQCFEDDGESEAYRDEKYWTWRLQILGSRSGLSVKIECHGDGYPQAGQTILFLPRQEMRPIDLQGGSIVSDSCLGAQRELRIALS
jgi:alpha-glucosidase